MLTRIPSYPLNGNFDGSYTKGHRDGWRLARERQVDSENRAADGINVAAVGLYLAKNVLEGYVVLVPREVEVRRWMLRYFASLEDLDAQQWHAVMEFALKLFSSYRSEAVELVKSVGPRRAKGQRFPSEFPAFLAELSANGAVNGGARYSDPPSLDPETGKELRAIDSVPQRTDYAAAVDQNGCFDIEYAKGLHDGYRSAWRVSQGMLY